MKKRLTIMILSLLALASFWLLFAATGSPTSSSIGPKTIRKTKPLHLENTENAGNFKLDHFKVYQIDPQPANYQVWLLGQFDPDFKFAQLYQYSRFLNPVDKNGEGIIDKFAHLNWYDIDTEPEPIRMVSLYNQFGLQTIRIGQAVALLVPAEKVEPGSQFPDRLDHYKVYEVLNAEPVEWPVSLVDQFGYEDNIAHVARYFAVPVEKRHNGQHYPIQNPKDHIVFYVLDPRPLVEYRPTVDQFGDHDMRTQWSELLGVPTDKLGWQEY